MKKRIAVERDLANVKQELETKGYEVVALDPVSPEGRELRNCDAIVISGRDTNMMGMQDITTKVPVIDASGISADEVVRRIEQTLR